RPLGDKIVAVTLVALALGKRLDELEIVFWGGEDIIPEAVQDKWERRLLYPIDVGMKRYHDQFNSFRASSACEIVVRDFGLLEDPVVRAIVALANQNNKDAFLKRKPLSYFLTLREWYYTGLAVLWVVGEVYKVTLAYIQAQRMPAEERERLRAEAEEHPTLRPYFRGIFRALHEMAVSTKRHPSEAEKPLPMHPFTMPEYCSNLFVAGTSVEEIVRIMEEHISLKANADLERQRTEDEYPAIEKEYFAKGNAVVLHTDNPYAVSYATKRDGALLVVVQNSSGHRVICVKQSADIELGSLFEALSRLEPGLWYKVPPRAGEVLLNGGLTRKEATPSALPLAALKRFIEVSTFNY
ncbi:MAG: hypothetical protein AAB562_00085, partial [Patescibacteria group bacterium]